MSAPITAYRKKSFFTRYNNTNVEHLIAIIQQSDAIHLSRFYLDGYMPVRLDDGKEGGIGYVIIGGENATMHNLNKRGGSQRMRVGGDVVQLLNDGGLNTLGEVMDIAVMVDRDFALVRAKFTGKSAWYLSSQMYVQYRVWSDIKNDWDLWSDMTRTMVDKQTTKEVESWVSFEVITSEMRAHGIQIRGQVQNGEGWSDSNKISAPYFLKGTPVHFVNPNVTYFMNTKNIKRYSNEGDWATELFLDEDLTQKYEPQSTQTLYLEDGQSYKKWVTYGYSEVLGYISVLTIEDWEEPQPEPQPVTFIYNGYDKLSQMTAEDRVLSGGAPKEIYFNESNQKAYKSYSGSSPNWVYGPLADEGYYAKGNIALVSEVYYVDADGYYSEQNPINQ